ncbi:DUF4178 domain-containing protein [Sphingomonas sp.]|uniref:DUF4178 domain-containing protein n=1 Tax=Sphingomonas sp. TaxID=28214 RepID=UPI002C3BB83E|nr:DUF4178 domain-containing protein [Sphingomonas sp.]HTG37962.1 DUF4178 domain-containing protein [Sphingomonas sp.]
MADAPAATALSCPNCGGTITLRAAGHSVTVACEYCASILDVSQPEVRLVTRHHEKTARLAIPLGARGTLDGVEWEMVGWMARSDSGYPWQEFLLFNPYHGYRWLIEQRGGWSLGEQLTVTPTGGSNGLTVDGETYQPFFANGTARVDDVVGEFYWRVRRGDTVRTDDWVRPGSMLSREADDREVSWSRSRWLPQSVVVRAFGVTAHGRPSPPLPHQPSPARPFLKSAMVIATLTIAALVVAAIVSAGGRTLWQGSADIAADGRDQQITVGPVELTRPKQRVRVEAEVPALANGWVDMNYTLVDRSNQASFTASKTAERYSGRDSEGAWSEGSRRASADFAALPAGSYDLIVDYKGNKWVDPARAGGGSGFWSNAPADDGQPDWRRDGPTPRVEIAVVARGGTSGGVFFVMLLLILAPLGVGLLIHAQFEHARRAESDFAPVSDED